jgi:hypothetical protein
LHSYEDEAGKVPYKPKLQTKDEEQRLTGITRRVYPEGSEIDVNKADMEKDDFQEVNDMSKTLRELEQA